jgi:hypothetical protein
VDSSRFGDSRIIARIVPSASPIAKAMTVSSGADHTEFAKLSERLAGSELTEGSAAGQSLEGY